MNLVEAAKTAANNGETKKAGVISLFAEQSQWLANAPVQTIAGSAYAYNVEGALPGIAFRGINESYTESTGIINPQAESLRIAGGDLDVDMALVKMFGPERRAREEAMKAKALAATLTTKLIKGDSTSDPREFDGLQARLTGAQKIANGTTDGGDALSLAKLDLLLRSVVGPNKQLWMSPTHVDRLTAAARTYTVGGFINFTVDSFGQRVTTYNGVPIYTAYPNLDGTEPLAFTEVGYTGVTATASSIYCVAAAPGYWSMIQNSPIDVRDLGEVNDAPVLRTRVEWLVSMVLEHPKAAARLYGVKDGAVVA